MGKMMVMGSGGGDGSDECTATRAEVLKGYMAITGDSDDEPVGIIKKVGYLCVIAAAMTVDYAIAKVSGQLGMKLPGTVFFGLLASVWYLLNELLSIIENAGRMGSNVPGWLKEYIAVLREKIDDTAGK